MKIFNGVYKKPFHLCHYNKPKPPPLPPIKQIDYRKKPKTPVQLNYTTNLRNEIMEFMLNSKEKKPPDYQNLSAKSIRSAAQIPKIIPKHTKTYQYRYKLGRDIPVISCEYTEHIMMYKKPPFNHPQRNICGKYKIRNAKLTNKKQIEERNDIKHPSFHKNEEKAKE